MNFYVYRTITSAWSSYRVARLLYDLYNLSSIIDIHEDRVDRIDIRSETPDMVAGEDDWIQTMTRIASHPTLYQNVLFRSRLEARWACFFTMINYHWRYEPIDFKDWVPDFYVKFPCGHSECSGYHDFYAEVKPYYSINEFKGHPAERAFWDNGRTYGHDGTMLLGIDPSVASANFCHGAGGGVFEGYDLFNWTNHRPDTKELINAWNIAGGCVQWQK